MWRFHTSHFIRKFTNKMLQTKAAPQTLCQPAHSKRMSRFHKSHLIRNLQAKCRRQKPRPTLCASLRSRNVCQDFTRATLYGNLQVKCCRPKPRPTLCASLRSRNACQNLSHKSQFMRKITGKPPQTCESTLIKHRPLITPTVRTPQCGHTVWGKKLLAQMLQGFHIVE